MILQKGYPSWYHTWAAQNGYSFINSKGDFDLDAYEQAKKAYEAPHEDVSETITVEQKDADSNDFKPTASINPFNAAKDPKKTSEKKSYSQQLIKKIERDVAQMNMPLDILPDDDDEYGI